jgi:hypothetical protein
MQDEPMLVLLPRNPPVVHLQQERPKVAATHQHDGFVYCLVKHPFSDAWYLYEAAAVRQTEETSAEALTQCEKSLGTSMQVNGSLAPRSIESCLFIIFHGWNTIEAGHVY